jgi:ATP-binding cassette subfamily B multidrug efflux pump
MFKRFESFTSAFPKDDAIQPPHGLLAFCRHYTRGFEIPLVILSLLSAAVAVIEVSLFGFMGKLVDWLSIRNPQTFWAEEQTTLVLMGLLLLVVMPILVLFRTMLLHQTLLGNYPMSIRWLAHRYLLGQSVSFYQNDFAGRIATKVMQTALAVREAVMKLLDVMVYIAVYFISIVVMIAQADLRLALPMIIWLVAYSAIQFYFVPKLKRVSTEQADARSVMTGRLVDSYTNINTVKLFSHTDREVAFAEQGMAGFMRTVYQQMRLATGINICVEYLNYLLVFVIGALSIWLWSQSLITVGSIALAVSLALRINGLSHWIMWEISGLFENIGTVVDGMRTLSKPVVVVDKPGAQALHVRQGAINFRQVHFHYDEAFSDSESDAKRPKKNKGVIDALDLAIKPGEKIGLVGRSGAGKSTLVNLLMRFYDVESGTICIDGQNIAEVTQDSLRANIGMVTQDTSLLHRSIAENILYGKPDASEAELYAATRQAQADEFIENLTDPFGNRGYDSQVGERGVKLSGGQRQRIAIARVLLKNAPILLLDEATSALDSEVEAAIQESLYELMTGKTVIAIAHRLSTIAAMDRLIILDEGRIIEQGTHQELLDQQGVYAQLWAHQTGGFIGCEVV